MKIETALLKNEEQVVLNLRALYRSYGYSCFKMSKFEEYDLYGRNKEFLVSDRVITFTDTNGKLMALKPDVTLSIVKNTVDTPDAVERVYYDENVYRVSDKTHQYKEIMQTGLEAIGALDHYHLSEVLGLAAQSLAAISTESVLNISHLGLITALLRNIRVSRTPILRCLEEKNPHGLRELLSQTDIAAEKAELLLALTQAYGAPEEVFASLRSKTDDAEILAAIAELEEILHLCGNIPGVRLCVDLSLISDVHYYNGLIFRGYVKGIPAAVIRGGQYDRLMEKMGKNAHAIGFAVYLDQLERLEKESDFDVDVLLLYDDTTPLSTVVARAKALRESGCRTLVQKKRPEKLRFRAVEDLTKE